MTLIFVAALGAHKLPHMQFAFTSEPFESLDGASVLMKTVCSPQVYTLVDKIVQTLPHKAK